MEFDDYGINGHKDGGVQPPDVVRFDRAVPLFGSATSRKAAEVAIVESMSGEEVTQSVSHGSQSEAAEISRHRTDDFRANLPA